MSFEVSKMPMNELQKKCLEFLKLFRKKSIANELIEQTCYMLMTLPRDKRAEAVDKLSEYLEQNPTDREYRSEMSRLHQEYMG